MSRNAGKFAVLLVSGLLLLGSGRAAFAQESSATSDSAITSAIQTKMSQDSALNSADISVSTEQGVVTLSGTVQAESQQAAIDRIASTEPGVVKVVDGLSVAAPAAAENSASAPVQYSAANDAEAQNSYPNPNDGTPQYASVPSTLVVPAGTLVTVRLTQEVSSNHNRPGDNFTATLDQPIVANGWVVMRHGQTVVGRVAAVRKGGRVKGVSELGLELNQITLVDGQQVPIHTQLVQATAGSSKGRDAGAVGTTTGVGAMIGAIAEGGEGAGIGAAAGAAAGIAGVLLTRGRPTVLMPETLLTFRLESTFNVSTVQSRAAFRPVTQEDYPRNALQHRPDRYAQRPPPYGYYASPYGSYYGWGPYYPYYGVGYWWGRGYYRSPRYVRIYRGRDYRGGDRGRGRGRR
ncbi:MAG TPA: BON domain-containing protein [Terriglobia bacterium]|nr:BON domain-containing protein [Terriglobia bacterium]